MYLRELQKALQAQLPFFANYKPTNVSNSYFTFKHLPSLRNAIIGLARTGLYKSQVTTLIESNIFATPTNELNLVPDDAKPLVDALIEITAGSKVLIDTINSILKETLPENVYIKLPNTSDLKELSKYIYDFDKALSQAVINQQIEGKVVLQNAQSGSIWLEVFLGTSAAVTIAGKLFWAAAVIAKKEQEAKLVEEQVRGLQIKNESLAEILEAQKAATKLMIQTEAERLFKEEFVNHDPEQVVRLHHSIVTFSELIQKGAELHPSLNAPENVKNLFPKSEEIAMIESKTKQIDKQ